MEINLVDLVQYRQVARHRSPQRLHQGWVIIQPEGPRWGLDLNELVGQMVQDPNPLNEGRGVS